LYPDDARADLPHTLKQHVLAGFSPDLALDLVLNELVVRAVEATHASGGALALARGDQLVCRAATGSLAPDLGVPLNPREGLSGVCLRTHETQISDDTEIDPRIDPAFSQQFGVRSVLAVPVFDLVNRVQFTGVLEIFSPTPSAFSPTDQELLEGFAHDCARVCHAALELSLHKSVNPFTRPELPIHELIPPELTEPAPLSPYRPPYQILAIVLGSLGIFVIVAISFLFASRIGLLRSAASSVPASQPMAAEASAPPARAKSCGRAGDPGCTAEPSSTAPRHRANSSATEKATEKVAEKAPVKAPAQTSPALASNELVVYEKGKLAYRINTRNIPDPANQQPKLDSPNQAGDSHMEASSAAKPAPPAIPPATIASAKIAAAKISPTTNISPTSISTTKISPPKAAAPKTVWLDPDEAEGRIVSRTEPQYPPKARSAHRAGNVVLEIDVAEDGSVFAIRTLSGDPLLANAATEAVRSWRYQPYRRNDHPIRFHTDVTLNFAPSN
jgi:TonB family protein